MAWKEISIDELAASLGVNASEVREKQNLIRLIVKARKAKGLSQQKLAHNLGVTQSRIAQIESGVGTSTVSFEVLFNLLIELGYDFKIVARKAA